MKRIIAFISSIILIISLSVTAYSINIDGFEKKTEWENSSLILLLGEEEEFNNNISFGSVSWVIEDGSLFLCLKFFENEQQSNNSLMGVSVIVEDSDEFVLTLGKTPVTYDSMSYLFEGAVSVDTFNGATAEIRVGAKYSLPAEIPVKVRFIDSNSSYSNVYEFIIRNNSFDYIPEYTFEHTEKDNHSVTATHTATGTTAMNETTTRKSASTTRKRGAGLLGILFGDNDETTKNNTKPEKSAKTTVAATKNKTLKTDKYSYKTQKVQTNAMQNNGMGFVEDESNLLDKNKNIPVSNGSKYKLTAVALGAATLLTVAVLGTLGANKRNRTDK